MSCVPGSPKTGGRPKGSANIITRDLRNMVMTALSEAGGVEYLVKQANERPEVFFRLLAKCLPQTLEKSEEEDVVVRLNFSGAMRRSTPINGVDATRRLPENAGHSV